MVERKYTGILADHPVISVLGAADEWQLAKYTAACLNRDETLFAEFGIDQQSDSAWKELAFALAERHVPAYGAKRRGRPNKNFDENVSILLRWQEASRRSGCTDADAIRIIAKERGMRESTVRERIKEIKRSNLMSVSKFFDAFEADMGTEKMLNCFDGIHDPDDGLDDYIKARKLELSRPPYK